MSIRVGRTYLAVLATLFLVCAVWFASAWNLDEPLSAQTVAPAVFGLVALVGLVAGLLMFSRFAEAAVYRDTIIVDRVLRPRLVITASEVDEAVVLQRLLLPGRPVWNSSLRVVLRRDGVTVAAFTPHRWDLPGGDPPGTGQPDKLEALGLEPVVVPEPLTPFQADRRCRGAVSAAELLTVPLLWAAVIVPVVVVAWAVWEAVQGQH
jgi:hypothetical protein